MKAHVEGTADVDPRATLGADCVIWHLAQVREGAQLGRRCVVGRGAYIGVDVEVGDDVKIQNYALVYEPARLGDGVFIGPAVVLTNDRFPRSVDPDGRRKSAGDWEAEGVVIGEGASVGAGAVVVGGVTVGGWAMVGAGAVVTKDVAPHALVVGSPAKRVGWVGHAGTRLVEDAAGTLTCPATHRRYTLESGLLVDVV